MNRTNENKEANVIDKDNGNLNNQQDKTFNPPTNNLNTCKEEDLKKSWCVTATPSILHFLTLLILGTSIWGILWSAWGENWWIGGPWFRLAAVPVAGWASGQVLHKLTTLPPLLAALLTGIIARHWGILDMREYTHIDAFLRKVYPVIILGKASLGWDVKYMRNNYKLIASLGVLPWAAEVFILAVLVNLLLDFPWLWGFLLGSIYASVSCAVIMPSVIKHNKLAGGKRNWTQLICTAGGIDTALSVGVYGLIYSFIFYDTNDIYRYTKASLTIFVGVALGIMWGSLAGLVPHSQDFYVTELRVLFVLIGGLLANFLTSLFGWAGAGGVAVLACNATAATHWARHGWKLNNNSASTTYRVLWAAFEPTLFTYTGTFFVINTSVSRLLLGFAILAVCLIVRLSVTFLVCWNFTLKEKIYVCCTWITKSIVEAVLCPLALVTLMSSYVHDDIRLKYAEDMMILTIQAILITTPIGFLLTNCIEEKQSIYQE
ncbi:sodium/hydrogen exchanger 9B1-like [Galleria mellonella]|uniref:Sodium/hydrogen exchanger 9B1-like n=1 Tax=Galleria mellonella TaxID=7137 RepID=A0ABM3MZW6_GALME|nr:sodium/hydrogen exchanger 9B1-like [Galleria mellonella]